MSLAPTYLLLQLSPSLSGHSIVDGKWLFYMGSLKNNIRRSRNVTTWTKKKCWFVTGVACIIQPVIHNFQCRVFSDSLLESGLTVIE